MARYIQVDFLYQLLTQTLTPLGLLLVLPEIALCVISIVFLNIHLEPKIAALGISMKGTLVAISLVFLLFALNVLLATIFSDIVTELNIPKDLNFVYGTLGLSTVMLASANEELLFRGALYFMCPDKKISYIICNSLIFSLLHYPLFTLIYSLLVGLAFSLIFLVRKNLLTLVLAHLLYNSLIIILFQFPIE